MTRFDYTRSHETATRLLTRFGREGRIVRRTPAAGDQPWNPEGMTETTTAVNMVVLGHNRRDVDGRLVLATDRRVLVAAEGAEPRIADRLEVGDETYEVIAVAPKAPGDTILFYEVQARG